MRRAFVLMIALAVIVVSCGGDDDAASTTPAPAPAPAADPTGGSDPTDAAPQPTTAPDDSGIADDDPPADEAGGTDPGAGASTDFCGFIATVDASQDDVGAGFDSATFRSGMEESVAGLERARDLAPREIADDVDLVLDTFLDLIALFEEYEWDIIAIGTSAGEDPRLLSFDQADFIAAVDRIGTFCGLDLTTGGEDDPAPDPIGPPSNDVPDDVPAALVPPGATLRIDLGGGSFILTTTASFDDVVDFYKNTIGPPLFEEPSQMSAAWQAQVDGKLTTVSLVASAGAMEIAISIIG
jgi:hypothetical protein